MVRRANSAVLSRKNFLARATQLKNIKKLLKFGRKTRLEAPLNYLMRYFKDEKFIRILYAISDIRKATSKKNDGIFQVEYDLRRNC